ncbi:ScyD/ScyE family protein [Geodermatophilus sp. CPCC 205506]|uniref:ScyD/ScyE family protein n=1 Tax=Geodermatophilus sp. CPCC 205506 TaxID=2936596 RepID=UPI003EEB3947
MRKTIVAAGSFALLLGCATAASATVETPDSEPLDHVVVATGLDNPRQLAWAGRNLLVAEGGEGGEDCSPSLPAAASAAQPATDAPADDTAPAAVPLDDDGTADQGSGDAPATATADDTAPTAVPLDDDGTADQGSGDAPATATATATATADDTATGADDAATAATAAEEVCAGDTGAIAAVNRPSRTEDAEAERIVDDLYSVESAEGTVGSDGVAVGLPGLLVIAQGEGTPDALAEPGAETDDNGAATQEHLLLSIDGEVLPWVDLGAEEERLNPDGKTALDSNPNAVIVVDPTPEGDPGEDEYLLVADAGANAVWKVTPDFDDVDEDGLPDYEVEVFAAYESDDDEATPEFVPSALDQDADGNIYVGGVGSLRPGVAEVVRYDADGDETGRWGGFTGINGLAVEPDGEHVYVSQILGSEGPPTGTGSVVRFTTDEPEDATYAIVDVPFPSGLELGRGGTVYVSAYSTLPADADDPATEDVVEGGQLWRFSFPEDAEETALPVTEPTEAAPAESAPAAPADAGTGTTTPDAGVAATDDDGTADQGSGDAAIATVPGDSAVAGDDGTADQGSGDATP